MLTPLITNVNPNFFYECSWVEARQLTEEDIEWTNWVFSKEVMSDDRTPWGSAIGFCHMKLKPEVANFSAFPADAIKKFTDFLFKYSEKIISCEVNDCQNSLVGIRKEKQHLKINEAIAKIKDTVAKTGDQLKAQKLVEINKEISEFLEKERERYLQEFIRIMSNFSSYDGAEVDRLAGTTDLVQEIKTLEKQIGEKKVELSRKRNATIIGCWKNEDEKKYPQVAVDRLLAKLTETPLRQDFTKIIGFHN